MKLLSRAVLLLLAASAFAACGPKRIGDTDIVDSTYARAVLGVVDDYRKAAERRDADAVLAVVFPLQGDAKGRQHFRPAGAVDRLAVQKDPVEIEQDGFKFRHERRVFQRTMRLRVWYDWN